MSAVFIAVFAAVSMSFAATEAPTFTPTATHCTGEGGAVISPAQVVAGSCGNTIIFTYTAGLTAWPAPSDTGKLRIIFPAGWSAPSYTGTDPGYFEVDVVGGTLNGMLTASDYIELLVTDLPATT